MPIGSFWALPLSPFPLLTGLVGPMLEDTMGVSQGRVCGLHRSPSPLGMVPCVLENTVSHLSAFPHAAPPPLPTIVIEAALGNVSRFDPSWSLVWQRACAFGGLTQRRLIDDGHYKDPPLSPFLTWRRDVCLEAIYR